MSASAGLTVKGGLELASLDDGVDVLPDIRKSAVGEANLLHRRVARTGVRVNRSLTSSQIKYFEVRSRRTFQSARVFVTDTGIPCSNGRLVPSVVDLMAYSHVSGDGGCSKP